MKIFYQTWVVFSLVAVAAVGSTHAKDRTASGSLGGSRVVERADGHANATVTGPRGNSRVRSASREDGQNTVIRTGPQGNTSTRNVTREDGDVSSSVTGSNGRAWQRNVNREQGQTTVLSNEV